ncbi:unnamed protein product [Jaminaea pallidilutea]
MPSDNLDGDNPCHAHACALQSCMTKTLDQDKCQSHIDALYKCCNRFYEKYGTQAETDGCPVPKMTKKKLEGMGEKVLF